MKTKPTILLTAVSPTLIAVLLSGCLHKQVICKSTVLGIQAQIAGYGSVQIGLCRNQYVSNPTGTNQIHAAPLRSDVTANIPALSQMATEHINALTQ